MKQALTSDRIQDTLYSFARSQILFAAIDLDIFTHIEGGLRFLDDLAEPLQLDRRGLRIFLNGLVGIGFLEVAPDGGYDLPPDVASYLVKKSDHYMGGMVHHCKRLYENWSMLTDAVRSGQPVGGAQSLAQLETYFSELVKGLYVSNDSAAKRLAEWLDQESATGQDLTILDVAGGSAVWSIAMLERNPQARATLIDFSSVLQVAQNYIQQHGIEDRFTFWPGDLEEMEVGTACFDRIILANICHALGPIATQRTFQKLQRALKPTGRLIVVDFVPDDRRSEPGWSLIFGVNMLITTPEGDVFSGAEYTTWLKNAGFQTVEFKEIDTDVTAIIASMDIS